MTTVPSVGDSGVPADSVDGVLDPITLQILWSRLLSIADEVWTVIERTSFSTIVSAAHDFGAELMDEDGGSLGHARRSMPVFNLAMPRITRRVLALYPKETIRPGDVFCSNDPWLCAGHVPDFAIVTPVFAGDRLVAWAGSVCHEADMGGNHRSKAVREVYEEGLMIPPLRLFEAGRPNETLFAMIRMNVRTPDLVLGDIDAQLAANERGGRRLLALMEEYGLPDLRGLARSIQARSERAMRDAIAAIPDGEYRHAVAVDSTETPFELRAAVQVRGDEIMVDYAGTAPEVESGGVNCTLVYTTAQTHYAVKYSLTPDVPNNEGCFRPISVTAPPGSILNCTFPASVSSRVKTGWFLHGAIAGALAQAMPTRVHAEHGFLQSFMTRGAWPDGRAYTASMFMGGGQGAGWGRDGMPGWIFPSSASGVPTEVFEANAPLRVIERRIVPDSGGDGRWRGGPGYRVTVARTPGHPAPVRVWVNPSRLRAACQGFAGGSAGAPARLLVDGRPPAPDHEWTRSGVVTLRDDDACLTFELPGGGGMGNPADRDPADRRRDLADGYVTRAAPADARSRPTTADPPTDRDDEEGA